MARPSRPTHEPEIVALTINALRSFATAAPMATDFERDMSASFVGLGIRPEVAQRLIAHFDAIRPAVRMRALGRLGASNAAVPAGITAHSRSPSALALKAIDRPGLVADHGLRFEFDDTTAIAGGILVAPEGIIPQAQLPAGAADAVLAPERFTITYQGMHCHDETGFTDIGSDEVYIITSAAHIDSNGNNVVRTERHPLNANGSGTYGDVDSDETRIGPIAACWSADVADFQEGMSLTTVFFEHDFGDPDAFRDEVDAAVKLAIAAATYFFPPAGALLALIEASGLVTDFFNWVLGTDDDEIGTRTIVLGTLSELEDFSRTGLGHLWVTRNGKQVDTGLPNHFLAKTNGYASGYRVLREPPAPLHPIIIN